MSDLEMKSFGPFEIKSEDRGEVVAVIATLNVVDKDGDVILPGAFPSGRTPVKLSGYGHDVITEGAAPVGKGWVYEQDGRAFFEGKYFVSTDRGRQAFLHAKEMGAEGEWSFGFPRNVTAAEMTDDWRAKGAKRIIAGLTPIEASPVFVGAGWGTQTLLTKEAEIPVEPVEIQTPADEVEAETEARKAAEAAEALATAEAEAKLRAEAEMKAQRARILEALDSQRRLAHLMGHEESVQRMQRTLRRLGEIQ